MNSSQQPNQILAPINMNLPINASINQNAAQQSNIQGVNTSRRQSIFDPNQKYEQRSILSESKRPHYQQRYSNRKSQVRDSYEGEPQKKKQNCCSPLLIGLLGLLVLLAIAAAVLFIFLNKHQDQKKVIAEEENGIIVAAQAQEENLRKIIAGPQDEVKKDLQTSATSIQLKEAQEYTAQKQTSEKLQSIAYGIQDEIMKDILEENNVAQEEEQAKLDLNNQQAALQEAAKKAEDGAITNIQEEAQTVDFAQTQVDQNSYEDKVDELKEITEKVETTTVDDIQGEAQTVDISK